MSQNSINIPRGHLSTIILSTMMESDKYGYDIIKSIEEKTNGLISIKQPSLYSSLKRLEEQNLINSYWRDSDIGGKRHYYSLTDYGRKQTLEWLEDVELKKWIASIDGNLYANSNVNTQGIVKELCDNEKNNANDINLAISQSEIDKTDSELLDNSSNKQNNITVLQQESLFAEQKQDITENIETEKVIVEVEKKQFEQFDFLSSQNFNSKINYDYTSKNDEALQDVNNTKADANNAKVDVNVNEIDNKKTNTENTEKSSTDSIINNENDKNIDDQIYDVTKDLQNLLKDKTSFIDDLKMNKDKGLHSNNSVWYSTKQFSNSVKNETDNSIKITVDEEKLSDETTLIHNIEIKKDNDTEDLIENKPKDDGIFITEKLDESLFPKVRKIELSSKIDNYSSHSNINNNIKANNESFTIRSLLINDNANKMSTDNTDSSKEINLNSLVNYFSKKGVGFKIYNQSEHRANKSIFLKQNIIYYSIYSFLVCLASLLCYFLLPIPNYSIPILFIVLPIIIMLSISLKLIYQYKKGLLFKRNTRNLYSITYKTVICLLIIVLLFAINMLYGLNFSNVELYSHTFIYPSILLLLNPICLILYNLLFRRIAAK